MTEHTPGPWKAVPCQDLIEGFYSWQVLFAKDRIALIKGRVESEEKANAILIKASPVMLSALRQAHEAINPTDREAISMHEWQGRLKVVSATILQAIREAERE